MRSIRLVAGLFAALALFVWLAPTRADEPIRPLVFDGHADIVPIGWHGGHALRGHYVRGWYGGYRHGWYRPWGVYRPLWPGWVRFGLSWIPGGYYGCPPVAYPGPGYGIANMVLNIVGAALAQRPLLPPLDQEIIVSPPTQSVLPPPRPVDPPSADAPPPIPPQEALPPNGKPAPPASSKPQTERPVRHPVVRRLVRRLRDRLLRGEAAPAPTAVPTPPPPPAPESTVKAPAQPKP
jgi:hypothetical protein